METIKPKKYTKQAMNIWLVILISIIITFIFAGINSSWEAFVLNVIYGTIIGVSIALGSGWISKKMFSRDENLSKPTKTYISTLILVMVYILIDVTIINMVWFSITHDIGLFEIFQHNSYMYIIVLEFVIGIIIYLIILSKSFITKLDESYKLAQESKAELDKFRYATLKNQINPHFLFNTLNVLSGLIYKDVDKADDFIGKLANIYRYVLDVQDNEVVSVDQEIAFAKDYLFLQQIRFGNSLTYEISAESENQIIPLALQLLIENALKHNSISDESPLSISIKKEGEFIVVENSINLKNEEYFSHELGLNNIKGRYQFLSDKNIIINSDNEKFTVSLPILNFKK